MLFTSWTFAVFLPVVFLLHYLGRSERWQISVLTLASFVFYGWHTPWLVPLLAVSTFVNAEAARRMLAPDASPQRRRRVLTGALVFNLGALGFFKYARLLGQLLLPAALWSRWGHWIGDIPLPIGISFYTFQGISLCMDVYRAGPAGIRGLTAPAPGRETFWFHARVWFFKSFFPQLIAGPIVKANEFVYQIGFKRFADIDWDAAVKKLIAGFFLKMVVADNLKEATNAGLAYPNFLVLPKLNLIALLYGFSFQIFADFCGYSLIAMGLAKLFGYNLPINFNFPYLARSITEFWRRWHISLSTWLRLYLYIPLGGNRHGEVRTYVNLFLVMFLGGLWHGAEWRFAAWGTAHGVLLALERLLGVGRKGGEEPAPGWNFAGILRLLLTFNLVSALWLLFKLPKFGYVLEYARCLFTNPGGAQPQGIYVVALFSLPVIVHHAFQAIPGAGERLRTRLGEALIGRAETALYALLLFAILVNAGTPGEFIYFQF